MDCPRPPAPARSIRGAFLKCLCAISFARLRVPCLLPRTTPRRLPDLTSGNCRRCVVSRWGMTESGLEVSVTTAGLEEHDVAMEFLLSIGQVAWGTLSDTELRAYWTLLEGEIDQQAFEEKRSLFECRSHAGITRRLGLYGRASFAGTAAEYVHCLWHDVTVRTGPDYLPPTAVRRRLELLVRWFPPDRGHRLFPSERR